MNDATADDFIGMNATEFNAICAAEGLYETVVPPILSSENHVGLNEFYTDYNYGFELSDRAAESIGFKLATLGKITSLHCDLSLYNKLARLFH